MNDKFNVEHKVFDEASREAGTYGIKAVQEAQLLVRDRLSTGLSVELFDIPEYTSLCPRSGFPDFASIKILYVPKDKVIDEVSLKLYTNKFRDFRGGHETTVNEYMDDILPILNPLYLVVWGNFSIRGNVKTIPSVVYMDPNLTAEQKEEITELVKPYLQATFEKVVVQLDREF